MREVQSGEHLLARIQVSENNLQPSGWTNPGLPIRLELVDAKPGDPLVAGSTTSDKDRSTVSPSHRNAACHAAKDETSSGTKPHAALLMSRVP
jgi:hypothetical protein